MQMKLQWVRFYLQDTFVILLVYVVQEVSLL